VTAITPISPIAAQAISGASAVQSTGSTGSTSALDQTGNSFAAMLASLNQSEQQSDSLVTQLSEGQDVDLSTLMIAQQTTDINFQVAMSIRDKLVSAYEDTMRMQV